jgi:hypothetical protein
MRFCHGDVTQLSYTNFTQALLVVAGQKATEEENVVGMPEMRSSEQRFTHQTCL